MNKKLYKMLCLSFNRPLDKDAYEIYDEALKKYDEYYVQDAIKYIIEHDKFYPTIARIIEAFKEMPFRELTEDEKIDRWNKEGIMPKWYGKDIKPELVTDIEIEELNRLFEEVKK